MRNQPRPQKHTQTNTYTKIHTHNKRTNAPLNTLNIRGQFDQVIDVAGGNGSFVAALLLRHPKLVGAVVDQREQVRCCFGQVGWQLPASCFYRGWWYVHGCVSASVGGCENQWCDCWFWRRARQRARSKEPVWHRGTAQVQVKQLRSAPQSPPSPCCFKSLSLHARLCTSHRSGAARSGGAARTQSCCRGRCS